MIIRRPACSQWPWPRRRWWQQCYHCTNIGCHSPTLTCFFLHLMWVFSFVTRDQRRRPWRSAHPHQLLILTIFGPWLVFWKRPWPKFWCLTTPLPERLWLTLWVSLSCCATTEAWTFLKQLQILSLWTSICITLMIALRGSSCPERRVGSLLSRSVLYVHTPLLNFSFPFFFFISFTPSM